MYSYSFNFCWPPPCSGHPLDSQGPRPALPRDAFGCADAAGATFRDPVGWEMPEEMWVFAGKVRENQDWKNMIFSWDVTVFS